MWTSSIDEQAYLLDGRTSPWSWIPCTPLLHPDISILPTGLHSTTHIFSHWVLPFLKAFCSNENQTFKVNKFSPSTSHLKYLQSKGHSCKKEGLLESNTCWNLKSFKNSISNETWDYADIRVTFATKWKTGEWSAIETWKEKLEKYAAMSKLMSYNNKRPTKNISKKGNHILSITKMFDIWRLMIK